MEDTEHDESERLPASLRDGVLRARELTRQGISRQRIRRLTEKGELLHVGRGLYIRPDATVTENHTLAQVCARVPHGIVCLASALQFHNLTTQNPWQVWLMIERHARAPKLDYPPLRILRAGRAVLSLRCRCLGALHRGGPAADRASRGIRRGRPGLDP